MKQIYNLYQQFLLKNIIFLIILSIFYLRTPPRNIDRKTTITIGDKTFVVDADDLEKICDLGRGAYGIVEKMNHIPSQTIMAVKVSIIDHIYCSAD